MGILQDRYRKPKDIQNFSLEELEELSKEIRAFLIDSVSKTGGHLAPNLGVVELTLSIFNVFDLEKDKIIYDVGHQSYVHKMLTGRMDQFHHLRKFKGLSGFPKREESRYDVFDTGHASTSISAGVGMARARDLRGEDHQVVALIGDGALTGGMALEALNDVGDKKTRMIVILNDNEMSISKNVGGISTYLSQIRGGSTYEKAKKEIQELVERIPMGRSISKSLDRVKDGLKSMVVPGMLFEHMGLKYLGPVDGHNIREVSKVLKVARDYEGPSLVHVITRKGKGYRQSETRPDQFHGVPPFDTRNGEARNKGARTYSKMLGSTLVEMAEKNPAITAVTAAMPDGTGLTRFKELYPTRLFDVGIAEQHAVTLAAGLAAGGMKPFVAIYSTFLQRAFDQVVHDICIQKLPVTICIDRAGIVGDDGETHQGLLDLSFLSAIPNLTVMAPKSLEELRQMLFFAETFPGPLAIRYPRGGDPKGYAEPPRTSFTPGTFEVLRQGRDLHLYAVGSMVPRALALRELLQGEGVDAGVVSASFVKPLDHTLIKTHRALPVVTLEDNLVHGGFGSLVLEERNRIGAGPALLQLGFQDTFVEQGDPESLYTAYGLGLDTMKARVLEFLGERHE